jgi:hypothetical protein
VGSSGCGAGVVPSKQAKQTSKGLVFDAVRVRWRCGGGGAVLNKQARISKCLVLGAGARVRAYLKARLRCWVKCGAVVLNG